MAVASTSNTAAYTLKSLPLSTMRSTLNFNQAPLQAMMSRPAVPQAMRLAPGALSYLAPRLITHNHMQLPICSCPFECDW